MRERFHQRQQQSRLGTALKHSSWVLLAVQYAAFVVLVHHTRMMTPAGGRRYLTSTAVFLNEVMKLTVSLTMALYEVSKAAPASMPATSLLSSLGSAVFSGDSWKLVIPASLYTLANSLQYIGLSNFQASTFQATYQLKLLVSAIFGLVLLRRSLPPRKWAALLLLVVGVVLVQISDGGSKGMPHQNEEIHRSFPRTLEEWKAVKGDTGKTGKRSATYEGIEEDMKTIFPPFNSLVALLTTVGACGASGLAGVFFEKVLKDSTKPSSIWVRNVQLAIYSIFPALFIGVVFLDGEKIGNNGFFQGYNWAVWLSIALQAVGGIAAASSVNYASKCLATATSIVLSTAGSVYFSEFKPSGYFVIGATVVLLATVLYGNPSAEYNLSKFQNKPAPMRFKSLEKYAEDGQTPDMLSPNKEFSVKLPTTPFLKGELGMSSSRPTSPSHVRSSSRQASGSYFAKQHQ